MSNIITIKTGTSAPTSGVLQTGELGYCINSGQENGLYIGVNSTVEKVSSPTVDGIGKNSDNNIPLGAITYNSSLILNDSQKETARNNISAAAATHASRHASGGADELTPAAIGAVGLSAFNAHASRHASGGADELTPSSIGAVGLSAFNAHASRHASGGADEITPASIGAAKTSAKTTATLAVASWAGTAAPFTYTLSVSGVTATNAVEVLPAANITAAQLEALQGANIVGGTQSAGSIVLRAFGDKPAVALPVQIIVRGDL